MFARVISPYSVNTSRNSGLVDTAVKRQFAREIHAASLSLDLDEADLLIGFFIADGAPSKVPEEQSACSQAEDVAEPSSIDDDAGFQRRGFKYGPHC